MVKEVPGAGEFGTVKFPTVIVKVVPPEMRDVTGTVITLPTAVQAPNGLVATPHP